MYKVSSSCTDAQADLSLPWACVSEFSISHIMPGSSSIHLSSDNFFVSIARVKALNVLNLW